MMTHTEAARKHAMRRAWQRFGLALAVPDLREVERAIWSGKADWIEDQPGSRAAYEAPVKGRRCVVIFDIRLECVVTVLPCAAWAIRKRPSAA